MRQEQAYQQSAAAWRHAGHGVLLVCAVLLTATDTAYGETPRQEVDAALPPESGAPQILAQSDSKPASRDSLFGDDQPTDATPDAPATEKPPPASPWRGFMQGEAARSYQDPAHWSKERLRLELNRQGQFSENVKWKIGGRFDYDAAYGNSSFYAPDVRRDQRSEFTLRENYLDISSGGNWEFRLGRQHVVWGEMVGVFIADVVSARDQREFILPEPDLQMLRIPQWAARAEYFGKDMKAELLWIPVPSFDDIGKPGIPGVRGAAGADFYPYPIPGPGGSLFQGEDHPSHKLSNTNYGMRLSTLKSGWDFSGFYYHSLDVTPTFYRQVLPGPTPVTPVFLYQARHDEIDQFGGTLAKDLGSAVLKGEAVYTTGRKLNVTRIAQPDGLVEQKMIDYALGLDFSLPADARLNVEFFQRIYLDHDPDTLQSKYESGVGVLLDPIKLGTNLEGRVLLVHSLNRSDWLLRPKVTWKFEKNWRLAVGADIFHGPPTGLFGRFDNNDRVYSEVRYSF